MTILHSIGASLRSLLTTVPMPAVRIMVLLGLAALVVWVCRLPREVVEPVGGKKRWDENLKIGAIAALLIQIVIYSFL